MRFKEFLKTTVAEGHVEPNMLLNIRKIVQDGRVTNTVQWVALARFTEMIKSGEIKFDNPDFFVSHGGIASKDTLDALKGMPEDELLSCATNMLTMLDLKDKKALAGFNQPEWSLNAWLIALGHNAAQLD